LPVGITSPDTQQVVASVQLMELYSLIDTPVLSGTGVTDVHVTPPSWVTINSDLPSVMLVPATTFA
jgi:hypothetical protein